MRFEPRLSRRKFLRVSALVPGWLALIRLTPRRAEAESEAKGTASAAVDEILTARHVAILTAIGGRMTYTGDAAMPAFADTGALHTIRFSLAYADPSVREQLGYLLTLFEWGPPLFALRWSRFTQMTADDQDAYIRGWADSGWELRRIGFQALKNITMLGYYSQDETWKGIGYRGPWAPHPRRVPGLGGQPARSGE